MRIITIVLAALAVLALPSVAHSGGKGQDKQAVCHKPGTPAQHTLYLPSPAIQAHIGHGDTLGVCPPLPPASQPPAPPVVPPVICPACPPLPPGCPPTTVVTVVNNVTLIDQGAQVPPLTVTADQTCPQTRDLLFYSPTGRLGKVQVFIDGVKQRTVRLGFKRSAYRFRALNFAGAGDKGRLKIKATVRKRGRLIGFHWGGDVYRCGQTIIVDP